jgi:hypothetical protein
LHSSSISRRSLIAGAVASIQRPVARSAGIQKPNVIRSGKWKLVLNGVTHDGTPEGNKPLAGDDAVFLSDFR